MLWLRSSLLRRLLPALALALPAGGVAPGTASAASQSLSVTPCSTTICIPLSTNFYAGGAASLTMVSTFDSSAMRSTGGPSSVTVQLAAGVLADMAAARVCLAGTAPRYAPGCLVGNGTATDVLKIPLTFSIYLVPATKAGDIGGVDFVSGKANDKLAHAEIDVVQRPDGSAVAELRLDRSGLGPLWQLVTGLTVNINAYVNDHPFIRISSTATPAAPSALTVVYGTGSRARAETTIAAPDFTPTGASSLPYAPRLRATATKDATDAGVRLTTTVTQAADETASRSVSLRIPSKELFPNLVAARMLLNSSTAVGSATVVSPLIPGRLAGQVFLTGSITAPTLTIKFPPPIPLTLTGRVDIASGSFSFSGLPDVPLTHLTISLTGGPQALLETSCATASDLLTGSFVGYNGKVTHPKQTLRVQGCGTVEPTGTPKLRRVSLKGLATGHPKLRFEASHSTAAVPVASFVVALPRGLGFKRGARVRRHTCSGYGRKRKCLIAPPVNGLSLSSGSLKDVVFGSGKLVITLRRAVDSVLVTVSGPLLFESKQLRRKVSTRQVKSLTVHVGVTDTDDHINRFTLRLPVSIRASAAPTRRRPCGVRSCDMVVTVTPDTSTPGRGAEGDAIGITVFVQ